MYKIKFWSKENLACLVLLCGPILNIYGGKALSVFTICTMLLMIVYKFKNGTIQISYPSKMFAFVIAFLLIHTLRLESDHFPLGITMLILFMGFFIGQLDKELFFENYRKLTWIFVIFFYIQFFQMLLFGYKFSGMTSLLPLNIGGEGFNALNYMKNMSDENRCNSLFAEPSHFIQFLFPILAYDLFYLKDKYHLVRSIVWMITILLAKSGTGAIGLLVIGISYVIYYNKTHRFDKVIVVSLLSILPLLAGVTWFLGTEYSQDLIARTDEFSGDNDHVSAYVRVLRGFIIYDDLSFFEKLIGISGSTIDMHIAHTGLFASFDKDAGMFFNFVQNLLISDGLVVSLIFLYFILSLIKTSNYTGRVILIIFICFALLESMYFTPILQIFLLAAMFMKAKENTNIKTIKI